MLERLEESEQQEVDDFRPGISFAEFPEFVHSHNWHDPKAVCAFADFLRSSAENRALTGKMRTALDTITPVAADRSASMLGKVLSRIPTTT